MKPGPEPVTGIGSRVLGNGRVFGLDGFSDQRDVMNVRRTVIRLRY
jgi:hypothetical protein